MALIRRHHYSLLRTSLTLESGRAKRTYTQTGLWPDQLDQDAGQKKPFEGPNLMPLKLWTLTGTGPE